MSLPVGHYSHINTIHTVTTMGTSSEATPLGWVKEMPTEKAVKPDSWPPQTPRHYDWDKWCTFEVYSDPTRTDFNTPIQSKPDFSKARSQLDYSYHLIPAERRQELQDVILSRVVNSTAEEKKTASPCELKPSKPWIVFTAGAMGVGKGYVLSSLYKSKLFPLDKFLIIDPDKLKNELPEMPGYLQADPTTAATKVHRESTQMADVLLEHTLLQKTPILVDGSLRDFDYYRDLFQRIKKDFGYRIAIILVTAEPSTIHDRASQRAIKTGRAVPEELINKSIQQVPESVAKLSPYADAVFEIANNDDSPLRIVSSSLAKDGTTTSWLDFSNTWTDETTCVLMKDDMCKWKGMSSCWNNSEAHDIARRIWSKAYPNFCPRCTLTDDGQCGVCIHGKHLCACKKCEEACSVRKSFAEGTSKSLRIPHKKKESTGMKRHHTIS